MSGFTWKFDRRALAKAQVHRAAADALGDGVDFLLEDANRTVPIEEGTLTRSGAASVDRAILRGAVSYDTPYGVRQHEDTRLRHDPGRRAKWLEQTFREQSATLGRFLASKMRGALG